MPRLVWFNRPTNHSGTVNFLFLDPDGQVGQFSMYVADGGGPYILGGPALRDFLGDWTTAAQTLMSLLPAGIHVFPPARAEHFRQTVAQHRAEISDQSSRLYEAAWGLHVYSPTYTTTQCCDLLLQQAQPASAIVFVDAEQDGDVLLAVELAKLYYGLSQGQRKKLKLGPDWPHHWEA